MKGTPVAVEVESEFSDLSSSKSDDISRASSKSLATPAVRRIAGENNVSSEHGLFVNLSKKFTCPLFYNKLLMNHLF